MTARPPLGVLAFVAVAGVARGGDARAGERGDEKQACASAAEEAEQLRIDAHLLAARDRLLRCSRAECPAAVREDCARWMAEVAAAVPTVVLAARDAGGQDVLGALAWIDGAPVTHGLDGKALEVDPGAHRFRFDGAGSTVEQLVIIREGEKSRAITATLESGPAAPRSDAPSAAPRTEAPSGVHRPPPSLPVWTWVFGGVGLTALGLGTYLELSVNADASALQGTCGHSCSHAQVDPLVLRQQVLGPLAFGLGAVALGAATYILFATPTAGGAVAGAGARF